MRYVMVCVLVMLTQGAWADMAALDAAMTNARTACDGISSELNHMKTMAGINTAVTGVGTVAGGVALGAGIAKTSVDEKAGGWAQQLQDMANEQDKSGTKFVKISSAEIQAVIKEYGEENAGKEIQNKIDALDKKSKTLGNIRTGTMATATATNIAGALIAGSNRVKGGLQNQIDNCVASIKTLNSVRMQARVDADADTAMLNRAEKIVSACGAWETVNLASINTKSTAATVSSGVGAAMGLAGTITSASANSDSYRQTTESREKAKSLNNTANMLAGGTTVAGGVATLFNATQIGAIKRAVNAATECEEALK